MSHQVTWIATLRATLPAFADLRGGELALISVAAAQALDSRLTLANLVRRLATAPIAGVAFIGPVDSEDVSAAEETRMPLLQLPDDCNLRDVEREIARLVSDYEAQFERRGAQLYNLLTQRSVKGDGIPGLLETLAEQTDQSVACYGPSGELRAQRGRGSARIALQALRPAAVGDSSLLSQEIWVEPIGPANYPTGYLAIAGTSLDGWDQLAARQGAAALGLELAKEQAVQAAEERLRGDFVSSILTGPPTDPAALIRRGQELGYDLAMPHVAVVFHLENGGDAALHRALSSLQNELSRRNIGAPLSQRDGTVLCMLPIGNAVRPRELAETLRERMVSDYPGMTLAMGTPAASVGEWSRTVEEAEQALLLGRQLFGTERVLSFGDLGVYRLLVRLRETPELWTFYRETLSPLAAYDQKQDGELLKTLEAYFNHLGNLRATSEALHVHRNTLLYRLERIKQISGLDLSNADEHFALWLALRAHRILRTMDGT